MSAFAGPVPRSAAGSLSVTAAVVEGLRAGTPGRTSSGPGALTHVPVEGAD